MNILIYIASIFWSLFPSLIHVFQSDEYIAKLNATQLVTNGLIPELDINDIYYKYDIQSQISSLNNYYYSIGKNIFNQTSVIGTILTTNGVEASSTIKLRTDYINVKPSTTYIISSSDKTNDDYKYFYDINKVFISSTFGAKVSFTTPLNCYYIRFIQDLGTTNIQLELGSTVTTYETYIKPTHLYNVTDLIFNKQYSPLYSSTFDLTTDAQIKTQMDDWVTTYGGDLTNKQLVDNTYDSYFNTGFVDKTSERDFIDYLGYFFWLTIPIVTMYLTIKGVKTIL